MLLWLLLLLMMMMVMILMSLLLLLLLLVLLMLLLLELLFLLVRSVSKRRLSVLLSVIEVFGVRLGQGLGLRRHILPRGLTVG